MPKIELSVSCDKRAIDKRSFFIGLHRIGQLDSLVSSLRTVSHLRQVFFHNHDANVPDQETGR